MPVQRRVKLTCGPLFMRATSQAVEDGSKQQKNSAGDGKGIPGNAVGRSITAMLRIPYVKCSARACTQEDNDQARKPIASPRKEQPAIASFAFVLFAMTFYCHYSPHPERNIR